MAKEKSADPLFGDTPNVDNPQGAQGAPAPQGGGTGDADVPEALKGKSAKEVYDMMNNEHNRVLTETVQQITTQQAQNAAEQQPAAPPQPVPTAVPLQQRQQQQEEIPDRNLDPDGFMEYQFQKRLTPLVQQQVAMSRGTNRNVFANSLPEGEWGKYGEEVEQFMNGLAPQIQGHPDAYKRAYDIVLSSHRDEIVEEQTNKRTVATVTKTLANMGMTADQITEALKATAAGTPLQSVVQQAQDAQEQHTRQSLFQPQTGIAPMVDPLKNTVQAVYPQVPGGNGGKVNRHPDAVAVMEAFGMDEKEYAEYEAENTDIVSQINKGER